MICKKCHKKVIDVVRSNSDSRNRCRCNGRRLVGMELGFEMKGTYAAIVAARRLRFNKRKGYQK